MAVETSDEVGACLNKYYDYEVETCLVDYEKNYTRVVQEKVNTTKEGDEKESFELVNVTKNYIDFDGPGEFTNATDPKS